MQLSVAEWEDVRRYFFYYYVMCCSADLSRACFDSDVSVQHAGSRESRAAVSAAMGRWVDCPTFHKLFFSYQSQLLLYKYEFKWSLHNFNEFYLQRKDLRFVVHKRVCLWKKKTKRFIKQELSVWWTIYKYFQLQDVNISQVQDTDARLMSPRSCLIK